MVGVRKKETIQVTKRSTVLSHGNKESKDVESPIECRKIETMGSSCPSSTRIRSCDLFPIRWFSNPCAIEFSFLTLRVRRGKVIPKSHRKRKETLLKNGVPVEIVGTPSSFAIPRKESNRFSMERSSFLPVR